jgi:uncharacterized protein
VTGEPVDLRPAVTVRGVGRAPAVPDAARLSLAVWCRRRNPAAALDAAAERSAAVLAALRERGVATEDLATPELAVRPEEIYVEGRPPRIDGYVATQAIQVTVRDVSQVGAVTGAAVAAGGEEVRVNALSLFVTNVRPALEAARAEAWADAQRRAEQLSTLAGRRLGDVVAVEDGGAMGGVVESPLLLRAAAETGVPVEAGAQEVEAALTVRWELV